MRRWRSCLPPSMYCWSWREQTGHQIDRGVNLGHFGQKSRHAPVVLGAVQADPGHGILAGNIIGVVGLMLVPEEGQGDVVHRSLSGGGPLLD